MSEKHPLTITVRPDLPALAEALTGSLQGDPLAPEIEETVIVQSQGMRRWLTLELATALGCAGHISMPFPGSFIRSLGDSETDAFDRDRLCWRIFALLQDEAFLAEPALEILRNYAGAQDAEGLWHLASSLAGTFDNYQIYRPAMILEDWQDAPDNAHTRWQQALWQRLVADAGGQEGSSRHYGSVLEALTAGTMKAADLPPRLHVFGLSSLAPVFLQILCRLSLTIPVRIYVLSPETPQTPPAGQDNPLLVSMGGQTRDLLALLREQEAGLQMHWDTTAAGTDPLGSVLAQVQSDILNRRNRGGVESRDTPCPLRSTDGLPDRSLQFHICHSPQREMEVLYEQLLRLFEDNPHLKPHDVAVLVTDMEAYAPYISAVFGTRHGELPTIPWTLADAGVAAESPVYVAFSQLLRLPDSPFGPGDVLALLECDAVRQQAGIAEEDMAAIRGFVAAGAIVFGYDDTGRSEQMAHNLPAGVVPFTTPNTWRQGLDNLLLGYLMGPSVDTPVGPSVPVASAHHGAAELLGAFCEWVETLFTETRAFLQPCPLAAWASRLERLAQTLFRAVDRDEALALLSLQEMLIAFRQEAEATEALAGIPLPLSLVRILFDEYMAGDGFGTRFFTGGVTFCAVKPMRSIPFRVLAVCGMENGVFPRPERTRPFDLVGTDPRRGDRSLRADDRQTFLELLLAARDHLLFTWTGRSQKNNAPRAPSTCLCELMDYLDQAFVAPEAGVKPSARLTTVHRLQPFAAEYFGARDDPAFFSYRREYMPPPTTAAAPEAAPLAVSLPLPEDVVGVALDDLIRVLQKPVEAFCNRRLHVSFSRDEDDAADTESLAWGPLEASILRSRLLKTFEQGAAQAATDSQYRSAALAGSLRAACFGRLDFDTAYDEVEAFWRALDRPPDREPLAFELPVGAAKLVGRLERLTAKGRHQYRCAPISQKDRMAAWICHLVLNLCVKTGRADVPAVTILTGTDGTETLGPVAAAEDHLAELLRRYAQILTAPCPLFERATWEYSWRTCRPGKTRAAPLAKADEMWRKDKEYTPAVAACYGHIETLVEIEEAFVGWAEAIWFPWFDAAEAE